MAVTCFADESGTSAAAPCYTIGLLTIPDDFLEVFNVTVGQIADKNGFQGEVKWEKVRGSRGQTNLCLDLLRFFLQSPCTFHAIAVDKSKYMKWRECEEDGFYITYSYLLRHGSKGRNSNCKVYIDQRTNSYQKHDELMQKITNYMLAKLPTSSRITHVKMENSKLVWGLQAVDIITGAINTSYHLYFQPHFQVATAKKLAISRMANMLGWDSFAYDTMPNDSFNIWHFPSETRNVPRTRSVRINTSVPLYTREEFDELSN